MITLRDLTVRERIKSGLGVLVGKFALLDDVIYERRNNGEWRRVKDQQKGRLRFEASNGKRRKGHWPSRKQLQGALLLVMEALDGRIILKEQQTEVLESLADHFGLSEAQRTVKHPTAGTRWANMVHWAKLGLVHEGKLDRNAPYGTWALAPEAAAEVSDSQALKGNPGV